MKTFLRLLALAICARCFGADAANDIILVQRKSDNSGPVQRNVAPVATGLLGTDGSKLPVPVTIGANLTLSGTPLTLSAASGGNVTNNATLASGNIVIGGGTTVVGTTNISVSGGNNISNVGTMNVTTVNATNLTSSSATNNGQIPIWNTTNGNFSISTITQGANLTITNAAGAITIAGNYNGNVTNSGALASGNLATGGGTTVVQTITTGSGVTAALGNATNAAGGFSPIDGTATLTNKRVTARITTITSSATPTVNTDSCDCVTITALAAAITSMTTNLSGTPVNFDQLEFRILDNGTVRAITWGASFASGSATLPTTTVQSKALHVWFEWDSVQSKWLCVSTGSDA